MQRAAFNIRLSRERFMQHYQGRISGVVVTTDSGLTLQLPAATLRQFVGHNGIHGRFEVEYGSGGKLQSIRRI